MTDLENLKKIAQDLTSPHSHIQLLAEQDLVELLSSVCKEAYDKGYDEGWSVGSDSGYGCGFDDAMREVGW